MPFIIKGIFVWLFFILFVKRKTINLFLGGLMGVAIMLAVDYFGTKLDLYSYKNGLVYIGQLSIPNIISIYAFSMIFLYWLPKDLTKIFLYTTYISVLFLAIEAVMYSAGAIAYPHWNLWYSYFLINGGLLFTAYLYGFIRNNNEQASP